ncbi:undecaprenyldiphospho-muramoylpentapeptide beta-N-acetylglucosaminyltransferase [Paenibacillus woosongensis]|uniref:UDP-N-acetylglucosamine--N-acetylmuramyl-(pentapeptide) pyrophosphoryl-undecaprenol N-acetylglucosamine transferase n=1 Tax=Paenibacillus woosongensis TaxID=307580 RepID=A0AA95I7R6_9BACL|nr:undecaprenyldiphospho-muramoylpentapeptide beta-N-acetylglucosaminyltransferase [Paenibacillus woosongensis]WHX50776.1 undecaprenyldiphospho-muramoylpentapeptide beta-N-acetylglucosaminyltransferase [Paenibacillus woosongensis]
MDKIILTGGGTSGHVTPNLSLLPSLLDSGWEIHYFGTQNGIESKIVPRQFVTYHSIKAGKWRRYFDWKNFIDPINVLIGIMQATVQIRKIKPRVIFSKGGYVSVPVVIAGWLNRVPVIAHESDLTPGLANRISTPFVHQLCTSFEETLNFLPSTKSLHVGSPIREDLLNGDRETGLRLCGFNDQKPIVLILGGSLGSVKLNKCVRDTLPVLLENFQIVHLCGKGKMDNEWIGIEGYKQFEYVDKEMSHIYKITDIAVARSGSNSIFEFLRLRIPSLLIPLPKTASRGDQIINAATFERLGYSKTLLEEHITNEIFVKELFEVYKKRNDYIENMKKAAVPDGKSNILHILKKYKSEV